METGCNITSDAFFVTCIEVGLNSDSNLISRDQTYAYLPQLHYINIVKLVIVLVFDCYKNFSYDIINADGTKTKPKT